MKNVIYHFTDEMFPARETIENNLSKKGFELDDKYSGSSYNPALVYIFNKLIDNNRLDILETVATEIPESEINNLNYILSNRYGLSNKQTSMLARISRGMNMFIGHNEHINPNSFNDVNYMIAYIMGMQDYNSNGETNIKGGFDMIQTYWQEKYKVSSIAPFSFVENFITIHDLLVKENLYLEYRFSISKFNGAKTLGADYLQNTVAVAFTFSSEVVYKLVKRGLSAETIIAYINSGIVSSADILEWSENMPDEWANAILSGAR